MYDLERKEHDINCLKAKVNELNEGYIIQYKNYHKFLTFLFLVDKTRPYQMALLKIQKDLDVAKKENDNIQNMWLESQKENLKSKDEINRLQNDNIFLRVYAR